MKEKPKPQPITMEQKKRIFWLTGIGELTHLEVSKIMKVSTDTVGRYCAKSSKRKFIKTR